jgi:hypothetical protein
MHHHRVVLVVEAAVMTGVSSEREAGKEDNRDDKHDPGDDRDPGRELKDPGGPVWRCLEYGANWRKLSTLTSSRRPQSATSQV